MFNWVKNLYGSRWHISLIILFLILIIYMLFEIKNNRFWLSDFQVYHKAAGRIIQGEMLLVKLFIRRPRAYEYWYPDEYWPW